MHHSARSILVALALVTMVSKTHSQQPAAPSITVKYCFSDGVVAIYYADHSFLARTGDGREIRAIWQGAPGTGEVSIIKDGNEVRHDTYFTAQGALWLKSKTGGTFSAHPC